MTDLTKEQIIKQLKPGVKIATERRVYVIKDIDEKWIYFNNYRPEGDRYLLAGILCFIKEGLWVICA